MTALNRWVVSSRNHGRTGCVLDESGLPETKPKWQLMKCAKYGVMWEICANDSRIFLSSADLIAVSLDLETGKKLWETPFPDEATSQIAICNDKVCVAPYILSQENGEVLEDLSAGEEYQFRIVEDVNNEIFIITTDKENEGVLVYRDTTSDFFNVGLRGVTGLENGKCLIGFDGTSLVSYSTESNKNVWSLACPVGKKGKRLSQSQGYMVINKLIYQHMNYDTLRCIDLYTGEVNWQSGPSQIDEDKPPLYRTAPSRFLGCDDTLYLGRDLATDGYLQARSTKDGSELWRVTARDARMFLIAGDLLFGALSEVPVAWDRHTGEVVWRADKPMTAIYHAVAASNKIIYTNTMSQMRCYEWTQPYHSPAKA